MAVTHPIIWLVNTLSRRKARRLEHETDALSEEDPIIDLHYRRDAPFWFLPPPC